MKLPLTLTGHLVHSDILMESSAGDLYEESARSEHPHPPTHGR